MSETEHSNWPYRSPAEDALRNDAEFSALVSMLEAAIHSARFTPAELRHAVILAATRYEMRVCRPVLITGEQMEWLENNG